MNKSSSLIEKSEYILEEENKIIDKSNNLFYSSNNNIEEGQNKPKLISKKRELKRKKNKSEVNNNDMNDNEEIITNNDDNNLIIQNSNNHNSEMLVELIITNYLVSKWRNNIFLKKFEVRGFNKRRAQIKKGFSTLGKIFDIRKLIYLFEIFYTMINMPQKQGVIHDNFYGKIKIINKRFKSDGLEIQKNNNYTKIIENDENKEINESDKKNKIN